jgi:hypothetical protein
MSEQNLDQDEVVHVDDDGLGFTRADFPTIDYPPGARVWLWTMPSVHGTVVELSEAPAETPGDPTEYVPVLWDDDKVQGWPANPVWHHVDKLKLI